MLARDAIRLSVSTEPSDSAAVDVAIVGAGPCGLAAAIAAQQAGLSATVFDRGPIVSGVAGYPTYMTFFSTADRIAIGGVPFIIAGEKPTRRDALAYYRAVAEHWALDVRQYERVSVLEPYHSPAFRTGRPSRWRLHSESRSGIARVTHAHAVVVATGYFGRPNTLGVPGETLPHVRHGYTEGHYAWNQSVVVVGGGNSAVDAALEMYRAGARVTMVHFADDVDANIKPWVLPEIKARIANGDIRGVFGSRVTAIAPEHVVVHGPDGECRIEASHVYTMTGYLPEVGLLEAVGVPFEEETGIPAHDPQTMATPVAGIYLAGVIASGLRANRIFIENGRDHGTLIAAHIVGQ